MVHIIFLVFSQHQGFALLQAAAAGRFGRSTLTQVWYVWEAVEHLEAFLCNS